MTQSLLKKLSPSRMIALGFAAVILIGSLLLVMPFSVREGVNLSYIDALFTSTSAVCVAGLVTLDPGNTFTAVGQVIIAVLIQIGGLGVTSVGAGIIVAMGKKIDLRGRTLIREASNLDSGKATMHFIKDVLTATLIIELAGAACYFIAFVQDYSIPRAIGYSLFHSISAFNNAGFDILGHSGTIASSNSIAAYHDNVIVNLTTAILTILGGIGFLVIREVLDKRFRWKKLSMHAKVVISMSAVLIVIGTILLWAIEKDETLLGAWFHSVSARTAGFATTNMGSYSDAGLMVLLALMFIGASSGSTGGGIKTGTFFCLLVGLRSAATNRSERAFKYSLPKVAFKKAAIIAMFGLAIVFFGTFLFIVFDPSVSFIDALFEITSAFATVGLSTGITPSLVLANKLLLMVIMFTGRLGPLTIATLWYFSKGNRVEYPEGNIAIG